MKEIIRTNNLIKISKIQSILNSANIRNILMDEHTSTVEGSINAIQKRIMVSDSDYKASKQLIRDISNNDKEQ